MQTVNVKLPSELLRVANLDQRNLSKEAARLLALELYREGKVSLARAAELCQAPLAAFMDFASNHGVPPLHYSFEDLEEDRQTGNRLELTGAAGHRSRAELRTWKLPCTSPTRSPSGFPPPVVMFPVAH